MVAIQKAMKAVRDVGYQVCLYDCSNGISMDKSAIWTDKIDSYDHGARIKKLAKFLNAKTDSNIITPNSKDFVKICNQSETTIVLMDYDCAETVWFAAEKVAAKRCPYFIDLDERYDEPCEHDWNPHMVHGQKWPVNDRWIKITEDR